MLIYKRRLDQSPLLNSFVERTSLSQNDPGSTAVEATPEATHPRLRWHSRAPQSRWRYKRSTSEYERPPPSPLFNQLLQLPLIDNSFQTYVLPDYLSRMSPKETLCIADATAVTVRRLLADKKIVGPIFTAQDFLEDCEGSRSSKLTQEAIPSEPNGVSDTELR